MRASGAFAVDGGIETRVSVRIIDHDSATRADALVLIQIEERARGDIEMQRAVGRNG